MARTVDVRPCGQGRSPFRAWSRTGAQGSIRSATNRVVLVHGFQWTLREVAELTGTKVTTVQNHLERGLVKLRRALEGRQAMNDLELTESLRSTIERAAFDFSR